MTMRALIVLLAVLNLGVTAWWLSRPDAAPVATVEDAPSGIARLQLVRERPDLQPRPTPTPADTAPPPADTAAASPPERCLRLGPFADAAALAAAQTALRPAALRLRSRETREGGGRGWRVLLPPAADRAAADANAERLKAAGFTDLLVVADGSEANSVALGRFSSEDRAQQHAGALQAAGFAARAEPVGEVRVSQWIELALATGADPAALRRTSGAAQARSIDCTGLR
jgi:cell division septation protein DedD